MKATLSIETTEPVVVVVIPLRKCQRPAPERIARRVIDTTCDPVPPSSRKVVPLHTAVRKVG